MTQPERLTGTGGDSNVVFSTIYEFDANSFTDGYGPTGRLIVDASGTLYGVTNTGGLSGGDPSGHGVVFMLAPVPGGGGAYQYNVLHRFAGGPSDGARPVGGLTMDSAGTLYGTAAGGGPGWNGTVFKLANDGVDPWSWTLTNLYEFSPSPSSTNSDGAAPTAHLIIDSAGNLFGTTSAGGTNAGGTVFMLARQRDGSYAFRNLHNFAAPRGYNDTTGGLVADAWGNLYGLKAAGGAQAAGEIFRLYSPALYIYESLYSFPASCRIDPALPEGSLAIDGSGQLFGTTNAGGTNASGTVFRYTTGPRPALTTLYDFNLLGRGGACPLAGVILDRAGNLLGTTEFSSSGNGAVYELKNNGDGSYAYATLFEFTKFKRQGGAPENTLVAGPLGDLFGTTCEGGKTDGGVVFRIGETAEAVAVMEAGVVRQVVVTNPGRGYSWPPTVTITAPTNGVTAQADATIANGSVTAVSVTNPGSGYDFGPQVGFSPPS
jgi:uncharacterized repeat protein (TIGR03803 family)